jgi:transcriptional regulator with XRE-family HTH domain
MAENFGQLLKRLRARAGLTQDDLAKAMDLGKQRISDYESGRHGGWPTMPAVPLKLAQVLHEEPFVFVLALCESTGIRVPKRDAWAFMGAMPDGVAPLKPHQLSQIADIVKLYVDANRREDEERKQAELELRRAALLKSARNPRPKG